jgi:hypothetical protein
VGVFRVFPRGRDAISLSIGCGLSSLKRAQTSRDMMCNTQYWFDASFQARIIEARESGKDGKYYQSCGQTRMNSRTWYLVNVLLMYQHSLPLSLLPYHSLHSIHSDTVSAYGLHLVDKPKQYPHCRNNSLTTASLPIPVNWITEAAMGFQPSEISQSRNLAQSL